MYSKITRRISRSLPYIRATNYLRAYFDKSNPYFVGWGMTTHSYPPWHLGEGDPFSKKFYATNNNFMSMVRNGTFQLTQLRSSTVDEREEFVRGLSWRHFIVQWSVLWAARLTHSKPMGLIECGVCDGMTAYFAMQALQGTHLFRCSLYDAWAEMRTNYLLSEETKIAGHYDYLSLESTVQNLAMFKKECSFVKGYIPDSLTSSEVPAEVNWLHLDLNTAIPTTAALNFFWDRMPAGSVVLFDDYLNEHTTTKLAADRFFADRNCMLFPLPTNQAICFKA